jgi:hypothetical protein
MISSNHLAYALLQLLPLSFGPEALGMPSAA